ncbi:carboxylesterase family protein [Streptomyces sp. NPDC052107]|uniref:carboxylesterase family protein n=1 Tax=Streptomyces sp. NPDC052107 TaxID=3155632 RepID=UPI0034471F32
MASFGGDPRDVTVGGQSAGAYSALSLALDPQTTGLVDRVLLESGPFGLTPQDPSSADPQESSDPGIIGGLLYGHAPRPAEEESCAIALRPPARSRRRCRRSAHDDRLSAQSRVRREDPHRSRTTSADRPVRRVLGPQWSR